MERDACVRPCLVLAAPSRCVPQKQGLPLPNACQDAAQKSAEAVVQLNTQARGPTHSIWTLFGLAADSQPGAQNRAWRARPSRMPLAKGARDSTMRPSCGCCTSHSSREGCALPTTMAGLPPAQHQQPREPCWLECARPQPHGRWSWSTCSQQPAMRTSEHEDVVAAVPRGHGAAPGHVVQAPHVLQRSQLAALGAHAVHVPPVPRAADDDLDLRAAQGFRRIPVLALRCGSWCLQQLAVMHRPHPEQPAWPHGCSHSCQRLSRSLLSSCCMPPGNIRGEWAGTSSVLQQPGPAGPTLTPRCEASSCRRCCAWPTCWCCMDSAMRCGCSLPSSSQCAQPSPPHSSRTWDPTCARRCAARRRAETL